MELKNKVAVITGWTRWIWKSIVLDLLKAWIKVVINYHWNDNNAKEFEKEIEKQYKNFVFIKADVSKLLEVKKLFNKIKEKFWNIDILINNAWIFTLPELEIDERYKKVFEINFFSQVYTTEIFWEQFKWKLWKIVNISSIAWINPFSYTWWTRCPEYDCSKVAVELFSKINARNFDWRILVNSVAPWSTLIPMWDWADKDFLKIRANESMIKRFMKSEEISDAVMFLLKNDAMNWETIVVDWWNVLN